MVASGPERRTAGMLGAPTGRNKSPVARPRSAHNLPGSPLVSVDFFRTRVPAGGIVAITIDIWDCCRQKLAVAQHSRCCASIVGGDTSKPLDPFPETMTLGPPRASTDRWLAKSARPTMVGCPHRTARRSAPGDHITDAR